MKIPENNFLFREFQNDIEQLKLKTKFKYRLILSFNLLESLKVNLHAFYLLHCTHI
jgi:hypothetical protein